jgi:hypothetical protein
MQGYRDDDGLVLESDADEQILLTIPFQQVVKLHSLGLKAPSDSGENCSGKVETGLSVAP